MGQQQNINIKESESYLRTIFSTSSLETLTKEDIDNLLFKYIKEENQKNIKLENDVYLKIVNDIISKEYLKLSKDNNRRIIDAKFQEQNIIKNFLEKLFPLFNYYNYNNRLFFKLLMCPFILKSTMIFDEKCKILFECIKNSSCFENNLNNDLTYKIFYETFSVYLIIILSGFTKILNECLNENNSDEILRESFIYNLKNLFNPKFIKEYYEKLINYITNRIKKKENEDFDNEIVNFEDFKFLCEKNPQIIDYFILRSDFIRFAENKIKQNIFK